MGTPMPGAGRHRRRIRFATPTAKPAVSPKIIGGTDTTIGTAPFMAQLWYYDKSNDLGFFCGGSVISPTKILTVAPCVKDEHGKAYNWAEQGSVVTSTAQLPTSTTNADGATTVDLHGGQATAVLRQWNHLSYSPPTINNDIAVLTLALPVRATPIRLTTNTDAASYTVGKSATVYGWAAPAPARTTSPTR